jgi:hypothetical protein
MFIFTHLFTNFLQQYYSWEADSALASQENTLHFMEPEGSLPCLQEPATGPYPKPDESSPCVHSLFLTDSF